MAACVPVEVSPMGLCLGTQPAVHVPPYTLGMAGGVLSWDELLDRQQAQFNPAPQNKQVYICTF